ncbi:MAG: hypothetical protein M5U28_15040 [Sandaracinaceae bacterium]|nr:hypothetical protein [Sandaracinaceae bacterium]
MPRPAVLSLVLLVACDGGGLPDGWRRTPPGSGPQVVWDLEAEPLPDVPLPNDVATWPDPTSPTGRRVNASLIAPSGMERRLRQSFRSPRRLGHLRAAHGPLRRADRHGRPHPPAGPRPLLLRRLHAPRHLPRRPRDGRARPPRRQQRALPARGGRSGRLLHERSARRASRTSSSRRSTRT